MPAQTGPRDSQSDRIFQVIETPSLTSTSEAATVNDNPFVNALTHNPFVDLSGNIKQEAPAFHRLEMAAENYGLTIPCRRPVIYINMRTNSCLVLIKKRCHHVCTQILHDFDHQWCG